MLFNIPLYLFIKISPEQLSDACFCLNSGHQNSHLCLYRTKVLNCYLGNEIDWYVLMFWHSSDICEEASLFDKRFGMYRHTNSQNYSRVTQQYYCLALHLLLSNVSSGYTKLRAAQENRYCVYSTKSTLYINSQRMESLDTNIFTASKEPFTFSIALKQAESGLFVAIELTHDLSNQKYFIHVDQQKMDNIQSLTKYLETPSQLYDELKEGFNEITIDQSAAVSFEVKIGKTKRKTITLQSSKHLEGSQVALVEQLKQEIGLIKKSFSRQMEKMKLEQDLLLKLINSMEEIEWRKKEVEKQRPQNQQLEKQIESLKTVQKSNFDEALNVISLDIKTIKYQNQQMKDQLSEVNLRIQRLEGNKTKICENDAEQRQRAASTHSQNQLQKLESRITYRQKYPQKTDRNDNPHQQKFAKQKFKEANPIIFIDRVRECKQHTPNQNFRITRINNSIYRLSKHCPQNGFTSFIHAFRAYPRQRVILKMSIFHSEANEIRVGICTNEAVNTKFSELHPETISFDFKTSSVWYGKELLQENNYKVEHKRKVEMQVDLLNQKIIWRVFQSACESTIIQKLQSLPKRLRNRILFLHITMSHNQDLVDILAN